MLDHPDDYIEDYPNVLDKKLFIPGQRYWFMRREHFNGNRIYTVQPNFGVGLKFKNISLDYALANIGSQAGIPYSNVFSLKLDFYKKKKYHFE